MGGLQSRTLTSVGHGVCRTTCRGDGDVECAVDVYVMSYPIFFLPAQGHAPHTACATASPTATPPQATLPTQRRLLLQCSAARRCDRMRERHLRVCMLRIADDATVHDRYGRRAPASGEVLLKP